ncbi:MAG: lysozyme [Phycisphaerales bacterium]|nr:lysozyme [Phycisphaerales bacterium]
MRHPQTPTRKARAALVEPLETRLLMARLTGIDVSQFQGTMNWTTAASKGISFAFIRASRGDTVPDTQLANNMNPTTGARAKGIAVGVYHRILPFSNTGDTGAFVDPIVEADKFISAGGAYMGNGYMRPVIDVENGAALNTTPVNGYNLSTYVLAFVNRVQSVQGVSPMIYTGHYRSNLNSNVVAALPDLWIANWEMVTYGNPVTGTGGPPTSPWNPSPNWKFWQYDSPNGLGSQYGAQSTDIDLDVFNGSDINVLKQNFVTGAADIPTGPSPANNATNVSPVNLKLNWNDSIGAAAYDVYVDNVLRATNITQSEWTISPQVSGGSHSWRVVAKGVISDSFTHVTSPTWNFTASSLPLPGVPSGGTPNNVFVISKPVILDWADTPNASTYDVYLGTSPTPTYTDLTSSQTPSINPADGVRMWRVVAKNATGNVDGPQWQYTLDTVVPSATYGAQTPTSGTTFLDFTVTYTDATSGVDFTSLDSSDVYVTGPNGYSQAATLISLDANANGSPRIATYRIAAPGGTWDMADNGTYTVNQNASQVRDVAGGYRAAGLIANFTANFAAPFAYKVGAILHIDFDGTTMPIALSQSGGNYVVTRDGVSLTFNGVSEILATGTASADHLRIGSAVPAPLAFEHQAGDDSITVTAGQYTFGEDYGVTLRNVDLTVNNGASAVFAVTVHFDALTLNGNASMTPNGNNALSVKQLVMSNSARLDLADNDMIVDYTGASPAGTFAGGVYTGLAGLIQSGSNFGGWDGNGIVTTHADAAGGLTTLGIGEASDLLGIGGAETALFGDETVDATSVVIKYTYAGDANLDGIISGDDYSSIDFNVSSVGAFGYSNGDFNYDGIISGDDYSTIDFNISAQGLQL